MHLSRRALIAGVSAIAARTAYGASTPLLNEVIFSPSYLPEARAVFAAFSKKPTSPRKKIINDLIASLKSAGIWDSIDILYVLAAADSQAARINWKNPGVKTLTPVNAPTFTADRGYAGNGTTSRLDTGWTPSVDAVNFMQDSASVWSWCRTNTGIDKSLAGNNSPDPVVLINPRNSSDIASARLNNGVASSVASVDTDATGLIGVQRRGATDLRKFKNGVQDSAAAVASTGLPTVSQWICGANPGLFDTREIAFTMYADAIIGKELALNNAALEYMQAVGAA